MVLGEEARPPPTCTPDTVVKGSQTHIQPASYRRAFYFIYLFFQYLFILFLAASGLSCSTQGPSLPHMGSGMWALSLQRVGFSLVAACGLGCPTACGILVPRPGIEPPSPALEGRFLTTGPPGKSSGGHFKTTGSPAPLLRALDPTSLGRGPEGFIFTNLLKEVERWEPPGRRRHH